MILFYQIGIRLFYFGVVVASFFNRKARLWLKGRKNIFNVLKERLSRLPTPGSQLIWFHCASLGEFEQARPLFEQLKIKNEKLKILITFFSPSGYEVRKNYVGADLVVYLPLDTSSNAKQFLDIVNPTQVFFVKYDFWYNYLNELNKRKIPTYLVSANFRSEQFRGLYGMYLRKTLTFFTRIFVQNESSQKLLSEKSISKVAVAGDLRYDRVTQTASAQKKNQIMEMFKGESKALVCGSTWPKDEALIVNCQLSTANLKFIIAPHEISESHTYSLIHLFTHSSILLYSEISKEPVSTALGKLQNANVLIVDNIGMLSSLYQYADVAYIGGGFGAGIHNILEAVAYGVPVILGPNHHKCPEANELVEQGGGFIISNSGDMKKAMDLLFSDEKILKMASMICKNFVQGRKGATDKVLSAVAAN